MQDRGDSTTAGGPPDGPGEYRFGVRIHMPADGWQEFRDEHALGPGEPTRDRLAAALQIEIDGLGTSTGWWDNVQVN